MTNVIKNKLHIMNEELIKSETFGIEESKANELTKGLETILAEREVLKESYLDVIELEVVKENLSTFKELRLMIVKNRTKGIEKWHKQNKAFFLAGGRFVDAIKNKEIIVNKDWEEKLLSAEKHFENIEKERVEKLQNERVEKLSKYVEDADQRDLAKFEEDEFEAVFQMNKKTHDDRIAADKKAEKERVEAERKEQEERDRIAKENAKLKAEADAREKKIEAERIERERLAKIESDKQAKIEAERLAKENEAKKIQAEKERKQKEAHEIELKKERERTAKIEAEIKAKEAAEETRLQNELKKGDSEKVKDLITDLKILKTKYKFKSKANNKMYSQVNELLDKTINHINK